MANLDEGPKVEAKVDSRHRDAAVDDALGAMPALGVVLHSSKVYTGRAARVVSDAQHRVMFDWLRTWFQVFRMPVFFWVSGHFCALVFERKGQSALWCQRPPWLLIPLFAILLTLNFIQVATVAAYHSKSWRNSLKPDGAICHLWFLVDLIIMTLLATMLLPSLEKLPAVRCPVRLMSWPVILVGVSFLPLQVTRQFTSASSALVSGRHEFLTENPGNTGHNV